MGRRRLTYAARPLRGRGDKSLAAFSRRGDPLRPLSFRGAGLFIDNAGSDTSIVPLELTVTVTQSEPAETTLQISPESSAVWSLGRPGSRATGVQLDSVSGALPISSFVVGPTELTFHTGSEIFGPATFGITLYVEADAGDNVLELLADIPPGVQITAGVDGLDSEISSGDIALLLE